MATQREKNPDLSELMQMAKSDPGKQLLKLVQQRENEDLRTALANGNFEKAKELIAAVLETPEAQALVKKLREN